jgi:hypothetical protein
VLDALLRCESARHFEHCGDCRRAIYRCGRITKTVSVELVRCKIIVARCLAIIDRLLLQKSTRIRGSCPNALIPGSPILGATGIRAAQQKHEGKTP